MADHLQIAYAREDHLPSAEVLRVLAESSLAERRPVDDVPRLEAALVHSDLIITARRGDELVGFARSVTDFNWACYLADLAVVEELQGAGIGTELMRLTRKACHPDCLLVLLSAPKATGFYARLGLEIHPAAFYRARS